jgi:phage shock protein PspC (stress-responsive transcriptional regulator)
VTPRRLYRSRTDRQLAGVAGGIASYLDVDPTVVRILWILSIFFGGFGILLYIIMAFIVPLEPAATPPAGWTPGGPAWGASSAGAATGEPPAGTSGESDGAPAPADPSTTAPAWATTPSWETQGAGWQPPADWQPPVERGPGRGGLVLGVALVVFGGIALANVAIPGWIAGGWIVAAMFVALGIALLVGALRRPETTA